MSQFDVLNPTPAHPLNPDYGFQRKRPVTHLNAKANHGAPYFREITDVGHQFSLSWNDKLASHARQLKWYYEQYRDGFFTLIDHEGGGREYVGRFSTPIEPIPTGHNHWSIQQVLFDEVPGAPMRNYPSDWKNDAVWRLLLNDFGDRMVAAVSGSWAVGANANAVSGYHFVNAGNTITDQAAYVYTGYGFQFWSPSGPVMGQATILLDGVAVGVVDEYLGPSQSSMLLQVQNVPLGMHTVTMVPLNAHHAGGSGTWLYWDALKVMR